MAGHRWSGWPGAWCLDCGASDPTEQAIADGRIVVDPERGIGWYADDREYAWAVIMSICLEPGSRRYDPYCGGRFAPEGSA